MIAPGEALDLLANEESDSDDELERLKDMVEHGPEADAALASMLEQRRSNRKAGLLLAKRKQCVIRSRALDILESLLNRVDSAELLMPILPPLLVCVRKLQTGLIQSLQEGRAFEERLRVYIESKFCKKRMSLVTEGDKEIKKISDDFIEIPECHELISPILANIPLQLLSYYIADFKGCSIDQPRNLAKSVTVE